ncbi:MAG: 23S rRNA (guanosine(2251)-2'-O)-methyltransferase RlmB [Chloroflexi bacterium HGW-Chloroflexi-1]|nr:MAG: 23S rRNA (guanosine(2251)-2'-O)-methyltransferase RlmB [Chloroflexi bacterium HGW-Chloroflexi-1]
MELLYGRHAVLEALRAGRRRIQRVHIGQGVQRCGIIVEIIAAAQAGGCPVAESPRQVLERAGAVNHQGVVAEAAAYPYVDLNDVLAALGSDDPLFLALDHLQDVQNLGTLLRTAEAMAVTAVLLPGRRAADVTPAVVNASAGAVEHLRIVQVGNLVQALERLKAAGVWVAGLDASPEAVPLGQADLTGALALVLGAEGPGLSRLVRCDWLLAIPMYGRVASLNAAVAGSIAVVAARQARAMRYT